MSRHLWLQVTGAFVWSRYARSEVWPGAPGFVPWSDHELIVRGGAFLRAFVAGARCARATGMRGYRARGWALAFAWAIVAPTCALDDAPASSGQRSG